MFYSGSEGTAEGWYVDDILITADRIVTNDLCDGAIALHDNVTNSMNTAKAKSAGDPFPLCQSSASNGVWFTYTPPKKQHVIVSTCGSDYDTVLQVYTGSCTSLGPLACNDDGGKGCAGYQASVDFLASSGVVYRILACGYTGSVGQLQIVAQPDKTPPNVTCPADILTNTTAEGCQRVINFSVTAPDNLDTSTVITCNPTSGATFFKGTTTVTCIASDVSGNSSTCRFNIVVRDLTPPVVVCSSNLTLVADAGRSTRSNIMFIVNASDNCGVQSMNCTPPSGSTFPVGTNTVTCKAVDTSSNTGICSFTVTVLPYSVSNDLCTGAIALQSEVPYHMNTTGATSTGDPAPTCQNNSGNGVWFSYTPARNGHVVISSCGSSYDTVIEVFTGSCTSLTEVADGCNDDDGPDCPGLYQASVPFLGSSGVTYRILVAGYADSTGQLIMAARSDNTPPQLNCPSTITTNTAGGICRRIVPFTVTATDDRDLSPVITCNPTSGATFFKGTTTVTCIASDASGNSSTCRFNVVVRDLTPPIITCPPKITVEADAGRLTRSNVTFAASATDYCHEVSISYTPPSGSTFPLGVSTVTCTAVDSSSNSAFCTFTVTVQSRPVIIQQPAPQTVPVGNPALFFVVADGTPPLKYQWQFKGSVLPGETNSILSIPSVQPAHAGEYRVHVDNDYGGAPILSDAAQLTVTSSNKIDRLATETLRQALNSSVYETLRNALELLGFQSLPAKARVRWAHSWAGKDPQLLFQVAMVPFLSPDSSDLKAVIGILLGFGDAEDGAWLEDHPNFGGIAMIADSHGQQRTLYRILCETNGICSDIETVDDDCLTDILAPNEVFTNRPSYAWAISNILQYCQSCQTAVGDEINSDETNCLRGVITLGQHVMFTLGNCLPEGYNRAPQEVNYPATLTPAMVEALRSAGLATTYDSTDISPSGKLDGRFSNCDWGLTKNEGSSLPRDWGFLYEGIAYGGDVGLEIAKKTGIIVPGPAGGVVSFLFTLNDDVNEFRKVSDDDPFAVLEGVSGATAYSKIGNNIASEENPLTHDSKDWCMLVRAFPADGAWLGSPDYTLLASQFNEEPDVLECEWEDDFLPDFIRTIEGDRVWMRGQLIWDCGHFYVRGTKTVFIDGIGDVTIITNGGYRSEIHPPHALVTMRGEGFKLKSDLHMPAMVARVYISPWGGEANHPDDINVNGKVWSSSYDVLHTPYDFKIPLPPPPEGMDPNTDPLLFVRIIPADQLVNASAAPSSERVGSIQLLRHRSLNNYLDTVLTELDCSLWPDSEAPTHLRVRVPLTRGPIPAVNPQAANKKSVLQFKVAVGWNDAPYIDMKLVAPMDVLDQVEDISGILGINENAAYGKLEINPQHPLSSQRSFVPPDGRTYLQLDLPNYACQVRPYTINFKSIKVLEDHDPLAEGEWHFHFGANGEWRRWDGEVSGWYCDIQGNCYTNSYSLNDSIPLYVWFTAPTRPSRDSNLVHSAGYDGDAMVYGVDQDDTLGRIWLNHPPFVPQHHWTTSNVKDYILEYEILDGSFDCSSSDNADPAYDPNAPFNFLWHFTPTRDNSWSDLTLGPDDKRDGFCFDADDYLHCTTEIVAKQTLGQCRPYDLHITTEPALIAPDKYDAPIDNDNWNNATLLNLVSPEPISSDCEEQLGEVAEEFSSMPNIVADRLNFHESGDPDFFKIGIPDVGPCNGFCPPDIGDPNSYVDAAFGIIIWGDRDRPFLVTITNFVTGVWLSNAADPWRTNHQYVLSGADGKIRAQISWDGRKSTYISLPCPNDPGAPWSAQNALGLSVKDPDGKRNFYRIAAYAHSSGCTARRPQMDVPLHGNFFDEYMNLNPLVRWINPPYIRTLQMLNYGESGAPGLTFSRASTLRIVDEYSDMPASFPGELWACLLPEANVQMDITVQVPAGVSDFNASFRLYDGNARLLAESTEVSSTLARRSSLATRAATVGDSPEFAHYRLTAANLTGCMFFIEPIRSHFGATFSIDMRFSKASAIAVTPQDMDFGYRCVGGRAQRTITVRNSGNDILVVSNIYLVGSIPGEFVLSELPSLPVTLLPSSQFSFKATFFPSQVGERSAEVAVQNSTSDNNPVLISLTGTGQIGDIDAPELIAPHNMRIWTTNASAQAHFQAVVDDDCSTNINVNFSRPSGSTFTRGTSVVVCTAVDEMGFTNEESFVVEVLEDLDPPVLVCPPDDIHTYCMGNNGAMVLYRVDVTDNADTNVMVVSSHPSGSWFALGDTIVSCTATDMFGNTASCSFKITVEVIPPPLYMSRQLNEMRITWPQACSPFAVQTATSLLSGTMWMTTNIFPSVTDYIYSITVEDKDPQRFYRLKESPP